MQVHQSSQGLFLELPPSSGSVAGEDDRPEETGLPDRCQEHGIFRTFSLLFFMTFCFFYSSTFFSLSFTLQGKDKTCAIDPMT